MTTILETSDLAKDYGSDFKLGPISIQFNANESIAILGKNGAGKSTFFELITGNIDASKGSIHFLGDPLTPDSFLLKRKLGYLPQNVHLPKWVTAQEILAYACRLYDIVNAPELIEQLLAKWDISWFANRPLAACSHGMQKRVGLAMATIHNPSMLILDEPFSGLDIFHIRAVENTIKQRQTEQKLTLLCTHVAPYASQLCDRAIIVDNGQVEEIESWRAMPYSERLEEIEQHFFSTRF